MPSLISPKVITLAKRESGSAASSQLMTRASGYGLMNSEMTFVSTRNPLTGQRAVDNPLDDPVAGQTRAMGTLGGI